MRTAARSLSIRFVVLPVVIVLALTAGLWAARSGAPAAAQPVDVDALHRRFLDGVSSGDVDAVVGMFVEDAVFEGGLTCAPRSCLGRAEIRGEIQALVDAGVTVSVLDVQLYRNAYMSWTVDRHEARAPGLPEGVERILQAGSLRLRGDRIVFYHVDADGSDPQTRTFLDARRAMAPPPPMPPRPAPSADGRFVEVDGRRMYVECMGTGSPTIVLEGGAGSGGAASGRVWTGSALNPHITIHQDLARSTRVCAYDRAGYGLSDPGPKPSTAGSAADELHALLHAAGIEPPYLLVGISFGGPIVQLFATRFPDEVAGVVQLDPGPTAGYNERIEGVIPEQFVERRRENVARANAQSAGPMGPGGGLDIGATLAELAAVRSLPDVPHLVLSQGTPENPTHFPPGTPIDRAQAVFYDLHVAIARLAPRGMHRIVDNSGHAMNFYVPGTVVAAVLEVLEAARAPVTAGVAP